MYIYIYIHYAEQIDRYISIYIYTCPYVRHAVTDLRGCLPVQRRAATMLPSTRPWATQSPRPRNMRPRWGSLDLAGWVVPRPTGRG